jgi:hypothetical protein
MKDKDVLCSLGVSDARLKELIKAKAASNCDATATTMGITSDSLRALLDSKALMHDDAINRFYDLLEEDRKSSGQPLWAVGVPLMQALESGINGEKMLQDYIKSREANTQGECDAMELVQGDCIMAVHVPGHYIFIRVDHDRGRVEVADPLGLGITRTRGEQATRVQTWFQAQVLRLKLPQRLYSIVCNPESNLPRQTDSVSCGPFVCAYAFFVAMKGRYPTNDDFTCANKSALRYFIMHYLLVHPVQDNATKAAAAKAVADKSDKVIAGDKAAIISPADGKPFVFDFFQPASIASEGSSLAADVKEHFCTGCGHVFSTKQHATRC